MNLGEAVIIAVSWIIPVYFYCQITHILLKMLSPNVSFVNLH